MNQVRRLFDVPYHQQQNYPNEAMFVSKINGDWIPVSTAAFIDKVNALSRALIGLGVAPGERVAIVSANRLEWDCMDVAIQQVGAIVVPVYPNISSRDYNYIFNDAGIRYGSSKFCPSDNLKKSAR